MTACVLLGLPSSPARAATGVQIIVLEPHSEGVWIAHEFVDNAVIKDVAKSLGSDRFLLSSAIQCADAASDAVSIVSARSEPLVVFSAGYVTSLEERVADAKRALESAELEGELRRQLLGGLFQVPFWPYLAASEVPVRGIDVERGFRLPHMRKESFPAAAYAGAGQVARWEVSSFSEDGVELTESGVDGEGKGVSIDYRLEVEPERCSFRLRGGAHVAALYVAGPENRRLSGCEVRALSAGELLALLDEPSGEREGLVRHAGTRIEDDAGLLSRYLAATIPADEDLVISWVASPMEEPIAVASAKRLIGLPGAILVCWLAFAVALFCANWLYPYASVTAGELLWRGLASYPLFLGLSFLLSGLWGMGFVPAAAGVSRFLAPEGKRLAAFGAVLAASFLVALVSGVVTR